MGNIREKPDKSKKSEVFRHKKLAYVTSSMCGWRQFMEDSMMAVYPFCGTEDLGLFGIFDGHGGPECAEFAAKYFPKILEENENFISKRYEEALTETFLKIDQMMISKAGMIEISKIREKNAENGNAQNYVGDTVSGTTANVCLLTKDFIFVANAGDSRSIGIMKSRNPKPKIKILSKDHKPDNDIEKSRILKAGGTISKEGRINGNLNLSRGLGDFTYKMNPHLDAKNQIISPLPDIIKVSRGDITHILMGCDGIWERKSNEEMAKWLNKALQNQALNLKKIIESLFNEEIAENKEEEDGLDNMSAILLQL